MDVHEPDEDFESIPWASITGRDRRPAWQPAAAGIVVGAALVFLVFRPSSEPVITDVDAPSASSTVVAEATSTTQTSPPQSILPEADLMAVESPDLEAAAGSLARRFLADFFTVDDEGRSAAERWIDLPADAEFRAGDVVVDDVEVVDARRVAPDRVVVTAEVRRSPRSDPGTVDRTSFEVEVAFGDAGGRIVDLPRPVATPGREVPPEVLAAGAEAVAPLAAGELLASEVHGGVWRLVIAARDRFGMVWPLAVTVDAGQVPDVPGDQEK